MQHPAGSAGLWNPQAPSGGAGTSPAGKLQWIESHPENSAQIAIEEFFNDPILRSLIDQALVGNQELKILDEDIQIANNEILRRRGAYLPFLSFGAGAGMEKYSHYTLAGAGMSNDSYISRGKPFPIRCPISW